MFVKTEVQALIHENSSENCHYCHVQISWAFTAQVSGQTVHEDSEAFHHTTSSMTMEVMAVTKALS
jgi:ribonuclease HI